VVKTCVANMDTSAVCVGEPENPTGGVQSTLFKQARQAIKRKCNFNMLDVEDVDSGPAHWPGFLVIESASSDRPVTALSPFAICEGVARLHRHCNVGEEAPFRSNTCSGG